MYQNVTSYSYFEKKSRKEYNMENLADDEMSSFEKAILELVEG